MAKSTSNSGATSCISSPLSSSASSSSSPSKASRKSTQRPADRRKRLAANARERKRMHLLNNAYDELRRRLVDAENKSKYDVLVQAKEYIQALAKICENFDSKQSQPTVKPLEKIESQASHHDVDDGDDDDWCKQSSLASPASGSFSATTPASCSAPSPSTTIISSNDYSHTQQCQQRAAPTNGLSIFCADEAQIVTKAHVSSIVKQEFENFHGLQPVATLATNQSLLINTHQLYSLQHNIFNQVQQQQMQQQQQQQQQQKVKLAYYNRNHYQNTCRFMFADSRSETVTR